MWAYDRLAKKQIDEFSERTLDEDFARFAAYLERARALADRLGASFRAAGAVPVEADILQPADRLLDLYGEDIRARAFVTSDPLRGEAMLRPDFTVPVVEMHLSAAHGEIRGSVVRQPSALPARRRPHRLMPRHVA